MPETSLCSPSPTSYKQISLPEEAHKEPKRKKLEGWQITPTNLSNINE